MWAEILKDKVVRFSSDKDVRRMSAEFINSIKRDRAIYELYEASM